MRPHFFVTLLVVLALVSAMGMGSAAAESDNQTAIDNATDAGEQLVNETTDALEDDDEPEDEPAESDDRADDPDGDLGDDPDAEGDELEDEPDDDQEEDEPNSVAALEHSEPMELTDRVTLEGWEIRDGRVTMVFHSETRATVTVSDALAGVGEDGAVAVPETTEQLERHGETTVTMDVSEFQGGSSVGVNVDGQTVRLSSEMDETGENPLQYFGGESGLFTGMLMSVLLSGAAAGFVMWREETGVIEA